MGPADLLVDACTQEEFGALVGVSQQTVSELVLRGHLVPGQPAGTWLLAYCRRLREQAAGRGEDNVLARERAALARAQRLGQEIKNARSLGEFAPVGLLGDVLATASAAVADRFDALPGELRRACPALPHAAIEVIQRTVESARNEWIRTTADLVDRHLDGLADDAEPSEDGCAPSENDGARPAA